MGIPQSINTRTSMVGEGIKKVLHDTHAFIINILSFYGCRLCSKLGHSSVEAACVNYDGADRR